MVTIAANLLVATRPRHYAGRRSRLVGVLAALGLVLGTLPTRATTPEELADFEAKADYAFYTEDANALRGLLSSGAKLFESTRPLERYQFAHAEFRLLQLARARGRAGEAQAAGEACLAALEKANEGPSRFTEGLALEAACAGYLASFGGLRGLVLGRRSEARLEAARALDAGNPRVLLTDGLVHWFRSDATAAERVLAQRSFARAAASFDKVAATTPGEPTWGGAEAWLFLGRALETRGDLLEARDAYEKALLIAPDFAAARRRLASLGGRH
jgi:tetratricopeptide (TPR) repeat protein